MQVLTKKVLNEITEIYFQSENVMEKNNGWKGFNGFYKPDGDNIFLSKISLSFKVKKIPSKKIRFSKLKKEIAKRFDDPGWNVKKGIEQHYDYKKREAKKIVGQLLWWSKRDGNGIIKTVNDKEYYFDSSVISKPLLKKLNNKEVILLKFFKNKEIKDCLAACEVTTFKSKSSKIEKVFNDKKELENKMRKLAAETNKLDGEFEKMEQASRNIKMKNVRMY